MKILKTRTFTFCLMRRAVEIVLVQLILLSCVFGSQDQGQNNPKELAIVVYSVRLAAGDDFGARIYGLWLQELKDKSPYTLSGDYRKILDAKYPLNKADFDLSAESEPEEDGAKVELAGHVTPLEDGAYRIKFSALKRSPIFSGTTGLIIWPKERRILRLPVFELGNGDKVETVVLLLYKMPDQSGEKSSLEID
jgi:hypothetical protein